MVCLKTLYLLLLRTQLQQLLWHAIFSLIGEMSLSLDSQVLWETYCGKHTCTNYSLGGGTHTYNYLRMDRGSFFNFAKMLRNDQNLRDTHFVTIEEQLVMFLHIIGRTSENRVVSLLFIRSGESISRYFNVVLSAILRLRPLLMKQPGGDTT